MPFAVRLVSLSYPMSQVRPGHGFEVVPLKSTARMASFFARED